MPNWGDNIHWDSGAHWSMPAPQISNRKMSVIATNVSKLPIPQKILKGQEIITKSTSNPNVPGNTAVLATFVAAQAALVEKVNGEIAARGTAEQLMTERKDALKTWATALNALAGFTESATSGNAAEIESAGFGVRNPPTPPQLLPAPVGVKARLNGTPGHTLLEWPPLAGAKSYNVEISPDPITPTSWSLACSCTTAHADVNGAQAGELYWYRVAGVNAKGQGPWSLVVPRPVM
jgi:hypothetical protein